MSGVYFAASKDNTNDRIYLGNGIQIKEFLDYGLSIYIEYNGEIKLVADPENTFYEEVVCEKVGGNIVIATPEDGWIGDGGK